MTSTKQLQHSNMAETFENRTGCLVYNTGFKSAIQASFPIASGPLL